MAKRFSLISTSGIFIFQLLIILFVNVSSMPTVVAGDIFARMRIQITDIKSENRTIFYKYGSDEKNSDIMDFPFSLSLNEKGLVFNDAGYACFEPPAASSKLASYRGSYKGRPIYDYKPTVSQNDVREEFDCSNQDGTYKVSYSSHSVVGNLTTTASFLWLQEGVNNSGNKEVIVLKGIFSIHLNNIKSKKYEDVTNLPCDYQHSDTSKIIAKNGSNISYSSRSFSKTDASRCDLKIDNK